MPLGNPIPSRVQIVLRQLLGLNPDELMAFIKTVDPNALNYVRKEFRTKFEQMRWDNNTHYDRLIASTAFMRLVERLT